MHSPRARYGLLPRRRWLPKMGVERSCRTTWKACLSSSARGPLGPDAVHLLSSRIFGGKCRRPDILRSRRAVEKGVTLLLYPCRSRSLSAARSECAYLTNHLTSTPSAVLPLYIVRIQAHMWRPSRATQNTAALSQSGSRPSPSEREDRPSQRSPRSRPGVAA
jgi:hypothetical protein